MSEQFDIAVVGSGVAGIAAAVCAARAGWTTLLLDKYNSAGGIGGFSGLTTLCGLFDDDGNFLNDGFTREFAESLMRADGVSGPVKMGKVFVQMYRPESFQKVAAGFLSVETRVSARWDTPVKSLDVRDHLIRGIDGIRVGAVIDCSGVAEAGRAAGELVLATDESTQAPSVVFPLENVARNLSSPLAVAQILSALARAGMLPISFMPGCDAGIVVVKFAGAPSQVPALLDFLRRSVPGFEECRSSQTEFHVARREGAMIVGRYLLTGADVLGARKFPDAVARSNWPVEQWSPDGRQSLRYLQPGAYYEIPARSLQAARTENLFMAGKSLSADAEAVASARVVGCCLATGAAAAKLAAEWLDARGN